MAGREQYYGLLDAAIELQAELYKRIPMTRRNKRLLTKHSKYLPNRMSPLELMLNNDVGWVRIAVERIEEEMEKHKNEG